MGREEQIISERLRKIQELKLKGINPYPHKFDKKDNTLDLHKKYSDLKPEQKANYTAKTAGRVISIRDMGKINFVVLKDGYGKIQLVLQNPDTSKEVQDFFKKYVDSGDFIGVEGIVFKTKRGELSILVKKLEILSKALKPLPEKWHGLSDKEERYRKRYLDLIMNDEVRAVFEKRAKILDSIREFLKERDFNEVDTPYLQTVYGGASAEPFKTHLNALDIDLYLSISPELYLKRLIVGGYEKVFSIARNFRNEGIDRWHNPEFTMMEIYWAYADYNDMMELTEDLFVYVLKKLNGSTKVKIKNHEIDFKKPWKKMTMLEAIKKYAKIDVEKMSISELRELIETNKIEVKGDSWGWYVQAIFEHFCEEHLIQPTFITDHPIETTPLCKIHRNDSSGKIIERFEPFCMGTELANAYTELNDPILQRKLLEEQQAMLSKGDAEAHPFDEDFVNAIEIGMPPTGGLGIGIDRMVILLTEQESIRDVILFPFMKPLNYSKLEIKNSKKNNIAIPISREEALSLFKKYNSDKSDLNHCLETEAIMRSLAKRLNENEEVWGMLGLLHDIDWGITKNKPEEHLTKAPEILRNAGFSDDFIKTIISHGYGSDFGNFKDKKRETKAEHALAAAETITGLIHAYALMRKTISGMDSTGLMKKFKDKKFAASVNREIIRECENLGLTLEEFFDISIKSIQLIAREVDLS